VQDTKWNRAKQVFHEALEKTAAERTRFVAAACADDPDVRAQVDALLAAHVEAGEFLALTTGAGAALAAVAAAGGASIGWPEGPGSWIGPYKLLQLIGEGGFGVVYMAEQEEPIRRRVALKIIKPGMDTKQVIARFESERQALAMMDHPNIAKVLDAGATVSGRPYFVMELVKGVPLTDYCDANRLSTRERLDLFAQVCNGVHHAHEKGIIHRDIKPSNVMVTLHDAAPVPKIIDFGVAKATNQRLTEKTLFTAYGACIGTPTYMSPEQAEMSGLDIDRRSDVYSLGVLLYELLTGTTPLDAERLRSAAFGELQRMIREDDPPTPSARLSTLGDRLTEVARNRHAEPQVLTKLVRGDLDWIVMKAIEKDRRRRYDSAAHIVEDVSRFVKDEPVAARRPSPAYRFRKFAKRRRVALAVVAGIVAALSLGVGLARFFGLGDRGGAARPTQRLVFDEVGNFDAVVGTRDGRHALRYNPDHRGYEQVEIASGRSRFLTGGGPDPRRRTFRDHDLAPGGRLIAALLQVKLDSPGENEGEMELRLFPVGGDGEGRHLARWARGHFVQLFGWSPNLSMVWVFAIRPDRAAEIASVDLASGTKKVLKTLAFRSLTQAPSLSPDGRFIAYHDADSPNGQTDLFLIATDGSRDVRIRHPASDSRPMFTPDGSGIVFHSTRSGRDLWFLPVADGEPAGEPRLVWRDIGPYGVSFGFGENGSLFYYFAINGWEIYTAAVDLARRIVNAPEHLAARRGEVNAAPAFSSDGRFLAFVRNLRNRNQLVLRELATGIEREFPIPGESDVSIIGIGGTSIDFCPDGRSVIVSGSAIFRISLDSGGAERIPTRNGWRAVCTADGQEIVYLRGEGQNALQVVRRSLSDGAETNLYESRPSTTTMLHRSPDGGKIAFVGYRGSEAHLLVMPSRGGEAMTVATSPVYPTGPRRVTEFHGVMWQPDGRGLVVSRVSSASVAAVAANPGRRDAEISSPELAFWRHSLDGGPAAEVGRMRLPPYERAFVGSLNYTLHPDGSRLAFQRHAGLRAQVWAIDNLAQFIRSGAAVPPEPPR